MKIYTKIEGTWLKLPIAITRTESYDYSGPVALLDRGQSKQVANQGMAQSSQDQANATGALANTNTALQNYNTGLQRFMQFGRQTYGANGEFMRDANTLANTTAAAGSRGIGANLALNAMRTGDNTANYANVAAESQRQADRDLTSQLATADQSRLAQLTAINQYGVDASKFPATVQAGLYGQSTSGASSNLSPAASAAAQPSLFQTLGPALIQGAATAAAGFCPCEGSMIRMADGSEKPVEQLKKGDYVWPIGNYTEPNEVLEDPISRLEPSWEIETESGLKHSGSATHTIVLASGGYAFMPELAGKVVIGELVTHLVKSTRDVGSKKVVPLKIGGNHAYMADGIAVLA